MTADEGTLVALLLLFVLVPLTLWAGWLLDVMIRGSRAVDKRGGVK
jgi:hypothetical protein